jgi:hypothetical protein
MSEANTVILTIKQYEFYKQQEATIKRLIDNMDKFLTGDINQHNPYSPAPSFPWGNTTYAFIGKDAVVNKLVSENSNLYKELSKTIRKNESLSLRVDRINHMLTNKKLRKEFYKTGILPGADQYD